MCHQILMDEELRMNIKTKQNVDNKKKQTEEIVVKMNKSDYKNKIHDAKILIESFLDVIYANNKIDLNTLKYMSPTQTPRISKFYVLPKLHKQNIPGRPFVSSINSLTENISEFLTLCIYPLVLKLESHVKDTKDFLRKIIKHKKLLTEVQKGLGRKPC